MSTPTVLWPPALDPWLAFSPILPGTMERLTGATLYFLNDKNNSKETRTLTNQIVQILGGKITKDIQEATHALWISNTGEDYLQCIESSLARSLCIPIVDANRWLNTISNLHIGQHWSDVDCDDYVPTVRRRDDFMAESLSQTLDVLSQEDPDFVEKNALKRAMELSMLDWAIVVRSTSSSSSSFHNVNHKAKDESPYDILGLKPTASFTEIKKAYRKLARTHHPDKGGDAASFERIARAYQALVVSQSSSVDKTESGKSIKSTAHWDSELKDHHRLVQELFTSHGANLEKTVQVQVEVLSWLGLDAQDAGSNNINEHNEVIQNSCFYLSLAQSYLTGIGATDSVEGVEEDLYLLQQTALQFKRVIEAAVVTAHPEWVESGQVGEHVQAFSDFLVYLLDSPNVLISDWSVVVFDTTSGVCDIYKGKFYDKLDDEWKAANTITIQYLPGHYQPLIPTTINGKKRPTLEQILHALDRYGVLYVVTDGGA